MEVVVIEAAPSKERKERDGLMFNSCRVSIKLAADNSTPTLCLSFILPLIARLWQAHTHKHMHTHTHAFPFPVKLDGPLLLSLPSCLWKFSHRWIIMSAPLELV